MKKVGILIALLALIVACNSNTDVKNKEKQTKETVKNESSQTDKTRKANLSEIKFVLFKSDYDPKQTYVKIKDYLEEKGMFYPRIVDHSTAANNVQMKLNETYLVVFGNPKMGTLLMQENPEVGLELPLKLLIYQDNEKQTWVLHKNMDYLKKLYFLKDTNGVIKKMNGLMAGFKKAVYNPIKTTQITEDELK